MNLKFPPRLPIGALAPLALLLFWLILLPIVQMSAPGGSMTGQAPLDLARREFLAGDYGRALSDYRRLAEQGSGEAEYWLAHMLELGLGTKADAAEAVMWLEKAANAGAMPAERRLGEIERDGVLVPQNAAKARDWLKRAAGGGGAVAESELGQLWQAGLGRGKDPIEAYVWLALAARPRG